MRSPINAVRAFYARWEHTIFSVVFLNLMVWIVVALISGKQWLTWIGAGPTFVFVFPSILKLVFSGYKLDRSKQRDRS